MLNLDTIALALSVYILAKVVVDAHIFDAPRHALKRDTSFLRHGGVHLLECRMCVAFWVTLGTCLARWEFGDLLIIWAMAHALRMQEREVYD
jgi:hypothetical protein